MELKLSLSQKKVFEVSEKLTMITTREFGERGIRIMKNKKSNGNCHKKKVFEVSEKLTMTEIGEPGNLGNENVEQGIWGTGN